MLELSFSSKLDLEYYIISFTKTVYRKFGALIYSMKFLLPEVTLHLYKSIIPSCIEYYFPVKAGAPNCHLEILDKPWKQIYETIAPLFAALNFASLSKRN